MDSFSRRHHHHHPHHHQSQRLFVLPRIALVLFLLLHVQVEFAFSEKSFLDDERNALLAFKDGLIDPLGSLSTWKPDTSPCTWSYIVCDHTTGRVATVNLTSSELQGFIGNGLFNLTFLKKLDLSNNALTGEIPAEITNLTLLEYLNLSTNSLTGSIPHGLSRLKNLKFLCLSLNLLVGTVPEDVFEMEWLEHLDVGANNITGEVTSKFAKLVSLRHLDLNTNSFFGSIPPSIGTMTNLEFLDISTNALTGEIPTELGNLSRLAQIDLSFNSLTGVIPPQLGALRKLGSLDLNHNKLYGSLPPELGNCPLFQILLSFNNLNGSLPPIIFEKLVDTLELIDLCCNRFTGEIPPQITRSKKLISIDLSENFLSGSIPWGFGKIDSLSLALGNNKLSGKIPRDLIDSPKVFFLALHSMDLDDVLPEFNCTSLYTLQLYGNRLKGNLPSFKHCNLDELQLQNNQFTGPFPSLPYSIRVLDLKGNFLSGPLPEFTVSDDDVQAESSSESTSSRTFSSLEYVDLSKNLFSGSVPASLFNLPRLLMVDLSHNRLSGVLPNTFNCPKLFILRLRNNSLRGDLPSSLFKCKFLQYIDVRGNSLSGNLSEQFGKMKSLITLLLSGNNFSGPIPSAFGNVCTLEEMDLSSNQLEGHLPKDIRLLTNLMVLNLSSNKIDGQIFPQLSNLSFLKVLDLSSNEFSGDIPFQLSRIRKLNTLDLSNNQLQGVIPSSILQMKSLVHLNVSYNLLQGSVPSSYVDKFNSSAFSNNSKLCVESWNSSCATTVSDTPDVNHPFFHLPFTISGIIVIILLLLSGVAVRFRICRLKKKLKDIGQFVVFEKLDFPLSPEDIIAATDDFNKKNLLGVGGFGEVFKGMLPDGKTSVAVKRLSNSSQQGEKEFMAEMETLGTIKHRNLVRLIGAYAGPSGFHRFLVYDFMCEGSLEVLFDPKNPTQDPRFSQWSTRLSIAMDIAYGLKYLHHDCKPKIIHRDLKPSNILLDKNLVAHIADFGLARTVRAATTHLSTAAFGTVGYMSLEYARKGKASEKNDVYAFGIILLQLITGKRPTDEGFAYEGLRHWVANNPTFGIVDWRLEINGSMQQVLGMLRLGLLCTSDSPSERPYMTEVVHVLENLKEFSSNIEVENEF